MSDARFYAAQLGDGLIRQAAALTDLNEACALLQNTVGITDGGIAGIHFSGKCPNADDPEAGDLLDWEDAWPIISAEIREAELRKWLTLEDAFQDQAKGNDPALTIEGRITFLAAANDLRIGDVVTNTDVLEAFPTYFIDEGARFVVVRNELNTSNPILDIRSVPMDAALMNESNLREWGNCVQFYGLQQEGYENDPGIDSGDREAAGNVWRKATLAIRTDNDLLTPDHRVAAVFTFLLAEGIGPHMAEVVRRNASQTSENVCHSHDFCDANMVMADAMEQVLGRPVWMPSDWEEGRCSEDTPKDPEAALMREFYTRVRRLMWEETAMQIQPDLKAFRSQARLDLAA
jgi:hypothetical protein